MGIIAGQGHCPSIGFIRVLSMEIGGLDRDAAKGCIHGNADKKRRCPAWEAPRTWGDRPKTPQPGTITNIDSAHIAFADIHSWLKEFF